MSYELSSKESNEAIGKRINERRNEMGLSQRELANRTRTSQQTISRIERGKQEMDIYLASKMVKALEITMEYLVYGMFSVDELHSYVRKSRQQ